MAQTKHLNARDSAAADLLTKQHQAIQSRLQGGDKAKVPIDEGDAERARPQFRAPIANMNATKPSQSAASAVSMHPKRPPKVGDSEATRPIMERLQNIQLQSRDANKADENDAYSAPMQSQTPVGTMHAPDSSKPAQAAAASMPKPKIRPNARDSASAGLMKQQWHKKFPDVKPSGPGQVIGPAAPTHPGPTAQPTQPKAGPLGRSQTFPQAQKPTRKARANVSGAQSRHKLGSRLPVPGPDEIQVKRRAKLAAPKGPNVGVDVNDTPLPAAAAPSGGKKGIAKKLPPKESKWVYEDEAMSE